MVSFSSLTLISNYFLLVRIELYSYFSYIVITEILAGKTLSGGLKKIKHTVFVPLNPRELSYFHKIKD